MTYGTAGTVQCDVDPAPPRARSTLKKGDTVDRRPAPSATGQGRHRDPGRLAPVGTNILTVAYAGNGAHNGSSTTVTIEVAAASPTITAVATPVDGQGQDGHRRRSRSPWQPTVTEGRRGYLDGESHGARSARR